MGHPFRPHKINLHRLDLVSLSLFGLIVRAGSISRGAELAGIAIGAASKRISDLESAVGTVLLERHSRGITLSAAGEVLLHHVVRILADVEQLGADMAMHSLGATGRVRLWANALTITEFLPSDIGSFAQANPMVNIDLTESESHEIVLAVLDGRADLGIFVEGTPQLGLQTIPYRRDRLVLVVPQGHVLACRQRALFRDAGAFDFVSGEQGTALAQRLSFESAALGQPMRIRIQARSADAICHMVAAGLGIAVLPHAAARPLVQALGLHAVPIQDSWAERQLLVGARDFSVVAPFTRSLLRHLHAQDPSHAPG